LTQHPTPTIPGFQLDRLLGEGGFGQVWAAQRNDGNERVAIKVLHFELVHSHDALTRFQRELAAIDRLHHPNVVRGLGHGTLADGRPYLVLEYLDGPSLREVIRERGAIPPAEVLSVFEPLCDALMVAHGVGLVHRDLKASNVVLARDARGPRPVLLDFGLVKLLDEMGPGLSSSRNMLGTPTAMAPEQMRGQAVDARTDVYALGLLAFHMLTGGVAFAGGTGAIKSYLQLHGPRPRPSSKVDIDPAIDTPITRALAPAPADRFATPSDFLAALRTAIQRRESWPFTRAVAPSVDAGPDTPEPVHIGDARDVIVFYIESDRATVAQARQLAVELGMTIALSAPDSVLAVAPRERADRVALRARIAPLAHHGRLALGRSRATFHDDEVDGPALDVETWAPYPLAPGLWISDDL
jgi:eukaryotic-like serine/threonine-protein kinase